MDKIKRGFAAVKRSYDWVVAQIGIHPQGALLCGAALIVVALFVRR